MSGREMLEKVYNGEVDRGTQIWILRQNLISYFMPYAHVLVYTGPKPGSKAIFLNVTDIIDIGHWSIF